MTIAAVVLAAGASTRLGQPKQNVLLGSETLLDRALRTAREAGLQPVFAVTTSEFAASLDPCTQVVINTQAAEGMASSIRAGVAAAIAANADALIILACDQPFVTAQHLRLLAEGDGEIAASSYAGRKGVPAYFPASAFKALLELRGDTGARDLLRDARALPLNKGELDIDTADDLKRVRELNTSNPPSR